MARLLLLAGLTLADELSHVYKEKETVTAWFNKANSLQFPGEPYAFSSLPLCRGEPPSPQSQHVPSVGEIVEGFEKLDSYMDIHFLEDISHRHLCSVQLPTSDRELLRKVVRDRYWLQLFVDDLLVWERLGKNVLAKDGQALEFLFTHFHLLIHYNNSQIIQVLYQPKNPIQLALPGEVQSLDFSYSVSWEPTSDSFDTRLSFYEDPGFSNSPLHWLVIGIAVSFLRAVYMMIKVLRREMLREPEKEMNTGGRVDSEWSSWKQLKGEVFRTPSCLLLLTIGVSAGVQLLVVAVPFQLLCLFYPIYTELSHMPKLVLRLYTMSSLLGGLYSGSVYKQRGGRRWIVAMLATLLALPTLVAGALLGLMALRTDSSLFSTLEGLEMCMFVAVPLHIAGTLFGRKYFGDPKYPCKVNIMKQPFFGQKPWFGHPLVLISIGGVFPWSIIHVEMLSILLNFWHYKLYYTQICGLMAILLLLTALICLAVITTFMLLAAGDPRWPWVSFLSGGSTALYIFLEAVHRYEFSFLLVRQWTLYLGYLGFACFLLFLICGSVGYLAAYGFVRYAYGRNKNS